MDPLRPGLAGSTQKSFVQAPQQYHHFQLLSPQQQQLYLQQAQAQGNISSSGSPLLSDMDPRRFRVLLGRTGLKDGQTNASSDLSQGGVGSPMQAASPLPRGAPQDQAQTELMMKVCIVLALDLYIVIWIHLTYITSRSDHEFL